MSDLETHVSGPEKRSRDSVVPVNNPETKRPPRSAAQPDHSTIQDREHDIHAEKLSRASSSVEPWTPAPVGARSMQASRSARPAPVSTGRIEEAKAAFGNLHAWDDASLAIPEESIQDGPEFGFDDPDAVDSACSSSSSSPAAAVDTAAHNNESRPLSHKENIPDKAEACAWGGEGLEADGDSDTEAQFVAVASKAKETRISQVSAAAAVTAVHGSNRHAGRGGKRLKKSSVAAAEAAELKRVQQYLKEVDSEVIPIETG